MKSVPKSQIVNLRYKETMLECKALVQNVKSDYVKAAVEVEVLKAEVIKSIRGESAFSQTILSSLISDAEAKCVELQAQFEKAQEDYESGTFLMASLKDREAEPPPPVIAAFGAFRRLP